MSSHMAGGYKCAVHCFFLEMFAARVSGSTTTRLDNSGTICFAGGGGGEMICRSTQFLNAHVSC